MKGLLTLGAMWFARGGKDLTKDASDNAQVFKDGTPQPNPYIIEIVDFGKDDLKKNVKFPESWSGYPLVFVQRLGKGDEDNAAKAKSPETKWLYLVKVDSNKVQIVQEKKGKATYSVLVMDCRMG